MCLLLKEWISSGNPEKQLSKSKLVYHLMVSASALFQASVTSKGFLIVYMEVGSLYHMQAYAYFPMCPSAPTKDKRKLFMAARLSP